MNKSIWKAIAALALATALLLSAAALGEARYPAIGGALTDDANALGQTAANDIAGYAAKVESETGVKLHVALVLFLDGEETQTYADTLFSRWGLGENDLLLLGAAAEDTFATATGSTVKGKLSDGNLKSLTYASGFADAFKNQRYDEAFGDFFVAFNKLLTKQYGSKIELGDWFAEYQTSGAQAAATQAPAATATGSAADSAYTLWTSTMNSIANSVKSYNDYHDQRNDDVSGLTPGGWIVLVIIVLIVFGQSGRARRARERGGCGCSPIGWIIGGLGLGALFGRRDDHDFGHRCGHGGCGRPPRW